MEKLRKYYVLAVAALNFVICAIAFFIWTRIVVMAQVDDKCIFVLISAFVSFIMCSIYATIANKKGVIPEKKRNSLSIITMLLSIIMVILAVLAVDALSQASERTKELYVPKIFSSYTVYNVSEERIKDKVYILKQEYRKEHEDLFK